MIYKASTQKRRYTIIFFSLYFMTCNTEFINTSNLAQTIQLVWGQNKENKNLIKTEKLNLI